MAMVPDNPHDSGDYNLFAQEESTLRAAEAVTNEIDRLAQGLRQLSDAYREGYQTQSRLLRLSDRIQLHLRPTHSPSPPNEKTEISALPGDGDNHHLQEVDYGLFEQEKQVLQLSENLVTQLEFVAQGLRHLNSAYRRSYREQIRMVKLSDKMQLQLQTINRRLEEQSEVLTRLATTDSLTQVHNRRHFMNLAAQALQQCQAAHQPLCLVMIDLDHFKTINDRYGHAQGDAVLIRFAELCKGHLAQTAILGRLGGEEFGLCLPEQTLEQGLAVAEGLRAALAMAQIIDSDSQRRVTASWGVAARDPAQIESLEQLLRRADELLYRAKTEGRNRVFCDIETGKGA